MLSNMKNTLNLLPEKEYPRTDVNQTFLEFLSGAGVLEEEVPLISKSKAILSWREAQDTDEGRLAAKNNLKKFSSSVFPLLAPVEAIRD